MFDDIELDDDVKSKLQERFQQAIDAKLGEETSGLKSKVDELLAEKKRVQQEREEARSQAKQQAEEKAKAENDYKQLFESQKEEANTLRGKLEEMNASIAKQKVSSEAGKIAAQMTKDTQRAALLQKEISQRLTIVDDQIRVTDDSGQLTVSTLDDLASNIKSSYPFLVDGTQANGGGAARSEGRAEERVKEISRAEFDQMDQGQRAEFFKAGGAVFNE